MIASPLAVK